MKDTDSRKSFSLNTGIDIEADISEIAASLNKSSDLYKDVPEKDRLVAADKARHGEIAKISIVCVTVILCVLGCVAAPRIIRAARSVRIGET